MANMPRGFDYLHLHRNVAGRVRALETGVHPTGSELTYYDTYYPELIDIELPDWGHDGQLGDEANGWYVQRRVGIVVMGGAIIPLGGAEEPEPDDLLGVLPTWARPLADLVVNVAVSGVTPPYAQIAIETDGDVRMIGPGWSAIPNGIHFEGPSWAVN